MDEAQPLPQSERAEKGLLGSMLLAPARVIDELVQQRVTARYFHRPAHAQIFDTMVTMREAGKPVDLISLTHTLEAAGVLELVGGAAAVTELFTYVPSASNFAYYLETVREMHLRRELIQASTQNLAAAYDLERDVDQITAESEGRLLRVGEERHVNTELSTRELAVRGIDELERILNNRGALTGMATGLHGLDEMTDGLHKGEMFVIAARPSMGKTALAMNIAEHVAVEADRPVAVYSLEMSKEQLMQRLICSRAHLDLKNLRNGFIDKRQFSSVKDATNQLAVSKLHINDTPGLTILQLRAHARRMKARHGIELIVIDYLQLLRSPSKRGQENRQVEVSEISSGIKALAREPDIPIIVLAQLNRNPETRNGKGPANGKPRLSDLRESGSIEQDADVVVLLWREEYYAEDQKTKQATEGQADLIIAKQRNGAVGPVPLTFLREFTRFHDRARTALEEVQK